MFEKKEDLKGLVLSQNDLILELKSLVYALDGKINILEAHIKKMDHFTLGMYGEFSREQLKLIKLDKEIDELTTELAIKKFKK